MLSFSHISSVLILELNSFNAERFLMSGFFIWIAYKIAGSIQKTGFKIFWVIYALLHLYEILQSSSILYNPFFFFATSVFFLQVDLLKYLKDTIKYFKDRAYHKYQSCVERNAVIESEEKKIEREYEKNRLEAQKQKQQDQFLKKLSQKLDFK